MIYNGAMNGIGSNKLLDIGVRPGRKGLLALDERGIVVEDRESLGPKLLVALPVLPEEGLRGRIFHNCCGDLRIQKLIRLKAEEPHDGRWLFSSSSAISFLKAPFVLFRFLSLSREIMKAEAAGLLYNWAHLRPNTKAHFSFWPKRYFLN